MRPSLAAVRDRAALLRRALALTAALLLSIGLCQLVPGAAEPVAAQDLGTCDVQFDSTKSEAGFSHPGIGLTESVLQNAIDQIAAGAEPWASGFEALKKSSAAGEGVKPSNAGTDPTKPRTTAFNSGTRGLFEADGLKSYTQAVMYVLTGKEVHRQNALAIIRNWEQMDPTKFEYYTDSHIHNGVPLFRMASAAELLRYTSCAGSDTLAWTDADTEAFSTNLIRPAIATFMSSPDRFMNQHNYPLLGSMAGSIFMDDADLYAEKVEWFTVNESAKDEGFNGSIARLARWVDTNDKTGEPIADPHVQLVEMGRDQAHGGGNITNFAALARMMLAQGTKVDPVDGTVSTADDAVGPYEFLDDRILHAADYFWQFMSGRDPEWTPVAYAISPDGTIRDTYDHIADGYRGRYGTASFWEIYYYYKFTRGEDVEAMAPYFAEAYAKRPGSAAIGWDGHDGGGDSWLFAPAAASGEANPPLPENPNLLEVEQRYTNLAGDVQDGDGYVSMGDGAKIAYLSGANNKPQQAFRIRTEGAAVMHLGGVSHDDTVRRDTTVTLPDTGGEWRYVTVTRGMDNILFIETEGATVDIDHININAQAELDGPVFPATAPSRVIGWSGADLTVDLAATAPEGTTYSATGLPDGAEIDSATGKLTWTGADSGTITIDADDGTSVAARTVVLDAAADREEALELALEDFEPEDGYESATEAAFNTARDAAEAALEDGTDAEYATALAGMVTAFDGLRLISPKSDVDGSLDYTNLLHASTAAERTPLLLDGDNQTGTSYPQAVNMSHTFDFGPDFRVSAREFGFQSNIFADRIANSTVYGSDDGVNWTRITPGATEFTQDFNKLEVAPEFRDDQFRYIKVQMIEQLPDVLYGIVRGVFEMTEFHIYGERHEIDNQIASASIASEDALAGKVTVGDTVTATLTTRKPVDSLTVNVMGVTAEATSADGVNWTAPVVLDGVDSGPVTFSADYVYDGEAGPTFYGTTDGSALFVGGHPDQFIDVAEVATVIASDKQWPGNRLPADQVGYLLFDHDAATFGDLNTSIGSYYTIDFGAGTEAHLDQAYFLPRASHPTRANGTIVQGSDDGTTWTNLTPALTGGTANKWIQAATTGDDHYRYFRIYNAGAWSGNLAEVEFYGDLA
jgi:hypothetical protein